jgi:hypothetical protein
MPQYKLLHLTRDQDNITPDRDEAYFRASLGTIGAALEHGMYEHVATLDAHDLAELFYRTNSIDKLWTFDPMSGAFREELRSTSVGDLVIDERGVMLSCQTAGWKEVPFAQSQALLEKIALREPEEPSDDGPGF